MRARFELVERLPLLRERRALAIAIAVLTAAAAWWVRWLLDPYLPTGLPFVTFLPAILFCCFGLGLQAGMVTGVLSVLVAWYWFLPGGDGFWLDQGRALALAFLVAVVIVNLAVIHWMQRANTQLRAERERSRELAERTEVLFRELQHRVSNNLQMAAAVLALHTRGLNDPLARQAITDASTKLQTIGRLQRQLYDTSGAQLPLDALLPDLVGDLIEGGGKPGIRAAVDVEPGILLPPDHAVPVALILAEAVANAIEHAYAGCDEGVVTVQAARRAGRVELSVADEGCGLPDGFDAGETDSMGLQIARTLARQLGADLALVAAERGATMRLRLPAVEPAFA